MENQKEIVMIEKAFLDELLKIAKANQKDLKKLTSNVSELSETLTNLNEKFDNFDDDFTRVFDTVMSIGEKTHSL